jgi:hypothetical protein
MKNESCSDDVYAKHARILALISTVPAFNIQQPNISLKNCEGCNTDFSGTSPRCIGCNRNPYLEDNYKC